LGGRPKLPEHLRRGTKGADTSNRLPAGCCRKLHGLPSASDALKMIAWMKKARDGAPSEDDFWQRAKFRYHPRPKKQLQLILEKESFYAEY
jgi:hypothetical protein